MLNHGEKRRKLDLLVTLFISHFTHSKHLLREKHLTGKPFFCRFCRRFFFRSESGRPKQCLSWGVRELQLLHPPIPTFLSTKKNTILFSIRKDLLFFTLRTDFLFETPFPWGGPDLRFNVDAFIPPDMTSTLSASTWVPPSVWPKRILQWDQPRHNPSFLGAKHPGAKVSLAPFIVGEGGYFKQQIYHRFMSQPTNSLNASVPLTPLTTHWKLQVFQTKTSHWM